MKKLSKKRYAASPSSLRKSVKDATMKSERKSERIAFFSLRKSVNNATMKSERRPLQCFTFF